MQRIRSRQAPYASLQQPWQARIDLGAAGGNLQGLYALYRSQGDVTINSATSLPTTLDGPIQVARYGTLTVNASLTADNRCRGLLVACDNLVLGASGHIHMDGKGAVGSPKWANQDITIPSNITVSGHRTQYDDFAAWLRENGYAVFDPSLFAAPLPGMGDVQADYADWPTSGPVLVSAAGCAAGTLFYVGGAEANYAPIAYPITGYAGTNAPGGGGASSYAPSIAGTNQISLNVGSSGGPATVWSGGLGAFGRTGGVGGVCRYSLAIGNSGQHGNPYVVGNGVGRPGGILVILVRNNIINTSGSIISANGTPSTYAGNGGGRVFIGYGGTLTGTLSMSVAGSSAASACGPGGAGAVTAQTFAQMGWS